MALRVDYVVKEMATNLRRNLTLTFATMVTISLTLAFVGAVLLINQGVSRSNIQFKGNVQGVLDGDLDPFMEAYLQWRRATGGS